MIGVIGGLVFSVFCMLTFIAFELDDILAAIRDLPHCECEEGE